MLFSFIGFSLNPCDNKMATVVSTAKQQFQRNRPGKIIQSSSLYFFVQTFKYKLNNTFSSVENPHKMFTKCRHLPRPRFDTASRGRERTRDPLLSVKASVLVQAAMLLFIIHFFVT